MSPEGQPTQAFTHNLCYIPEQKGTVKTYFGKVLHLPPKHQDVVKQTIKTTAVPEATVSPPSPDLSRRWAVNPTQTFMPTAKVNKDSTWAQKGRRKKQRNEQMKQARVFFFLFLKDNRHF